jgi:Kef-type K+ transport system membrane component KefB
LIFAPLFFAIIGAQVDFRGIGTNPEILIIGAVIVAVAVATKMLGCGVPAWLFLRNTQQAKRVGIGMVSRGEVGLIVAGVGLSSGVLTSNVYTTIVLMVAATSIITPIWLKLEYRKELQQNPT